MHGHTGYIHDSLHSLRRLTAIPTLSKPPDSYNQSLWNPHTHLFQLGIYIISICLPFGLYIQLFLTSEVYFTTQATTLLLSRHRTSHYRLSKLKKIYHAITPFTTFLHADSCLNPSAIQQSRVQHYIYKQMTALLFRLHHYTAELLSHWEDKSELIGDIS